MRLEGRSTLALVASLWTGCATTQHMTATELARRASEAPVAAQSELAGQDIVVQGVVRGTTLAQRESIVGQQGLGQIVAERRNETLSLVVLEPGAVLCYFEPEDIAQAADIKEGQTVSLDCRVDSFRRADNDIEAVLVACRRKSP
jgi:hypothetical protein